MGGGVCCAPATVGSSRGTGARYHSAPASKAAIGPATRGVHRPREEQHQFIIHSPVRSTLSPAVRVSETGVPGTLILAPRLRKAGFADDVPQNN